ncbi:MAG: metallopeptidase TldD-related protein [Candidatus Odinarchaeota archaeon]
MLSGGVSKSLIEICVYNTNGVESRYEKTILSKTIYGKSNNPPSLECQVTDLTLLTEGETTGKISDEFTNKLMLSLHPRKRSKINNKLILSPPALGELLYFTIGQAVTGESMLRRRSFLFDKIGQQVASDNLSIIDWGDSNNFVSGRPFDCEGTPTRKNVIVDHGVLKQAVYDIEWGNRSGEKSTGNAHRSYYTPPFIGLNTIHIPPTAGDNLLNELGHGYYIDTITGAHTSNSVTGDFGVVVVGGYEVKNGEILYPIYGPLIASSCQTLLNSIVNVGGKEEQVLINGTAIRFSPVMIEF